MKRIHGLSWGWAWVVALLGFIAPSLAQDTAETPPDGRAVMESVDANRPDDQSSTMTARNLEADGSERVRKVERLVKKGENGLHKVLIRFLEPKEVKGVGVLTIETAEGEDDQWIYLPEKKKERRIPASRKSDYFMGTEFAFEDIRWEDLDAHQYTVVGEEEIDGHPCFVVEAVPATEEERQDSAYARRLFSIRRDVRLQVKIVYFDKKGEALKTQENTDWAQFNGVWRPRVVTMRNAQNGKSTVLHFDDWRCNEGIDDDVFTLRHLKQ